MDRLSEMEAFAAVVDQGGFTGAAAKLGISKSAVSKHVSSLEARLGARLLNRTTRRVNPTEIGLVYYDRARNVLAAAVEADSTVASLQAEPTGTLDLVVSTDFGASAMVPLIGGFLERFSEIEVNISLTNRHVELLADSYDVALRLGNSVGGPLRSRRLETYLRYLVASPDYLARAGTPQRIEDLAQHRLLHFQDAQTDSNWSLVSPTGETRVVRTRGRMAANSGLCLRESALCGLGIAFLPDFLIGDDLSSGRLVNAMPTLPEQPLPLYAMYPPNRAALPRVRAFVDYMETAFGGEMADLAIA